MRESTSTRHLVSSKQKLPQSKTALWEFLFLYAVEVYFDARANDSAKNIRRTSRNQKEKPSAELHRSHRPAPLPS